MGDPGTHGRDADVVLSCCAVQASQSQVLRNSVAAEVPLLNRVALSASVRWKSVALQPVVSTKIVREEKYGSLTCSWS